MKKSRLNIFLMILLALTAFSAIAPAQDKTAQAEALVSEADKLLELNTFESVKKSVEKIYEARKIYEELKDEGKIRATYGYEGFAEKNIGLLYLDKENFDEAVRAFEKADVLFKKIEFNEGIAAVHFSLAYIAIKRNNPDEALAQYEIILPLYLELGNEYDAAQVLRFSGGIYHDKKNYATAEKRLSESLALYKKLGKTEESAYTANLLGDIYIAQKEYAKAETAFLPALDFFKDGATRTLIFHNLGFAVGNLGRNEDAVKYYEQALTGYRALKNNGGEVTVLRNVGLTYYDLKNYKKSIEYLEAALALKKYVEDRETLANIYTNLGSSYSALFDYEKGISFLEKAVEIRRELGQKLELVQDLNSIAAAYFGSFKYEKAIEYYEQVLKFNENRNEIPEQISALSGLRWSYYLLNRFSEAENYLNQAVALLDKLPDNNVSKTYAIYEVAKGFWGQKKYEESLVYYDKALKGFEKENNKLSRMFVLIDIGTVNLAMWRWDVGAEYFRQAQTLAVGLNDKLWQGYININLGDAEYYAGNYSKAIELYEKGIGFGTPSEISFDRDNSSGGNVTALKLPSAERFRELLQKEGNSDNYRLLMSGYFKLGAAQVELGMYRKSLETFAISIGYARLLNSKPDEINALTGTASANSELGNYQPSIEANKTALGIAREIRDSYSESTILNNLGVAYLRLGSLEKAEEYVRQSAQIVEKLDDPRLTAQAEGNLGAVYARLKQYDKAINYFDTALPKFEQQKNYKFSVVISYYYGTAMRETGNLKRAVELHKQAAELAATNSTQKFESRALSELGLDYIELKQFDDARATFEKALVLSLASDAKPEQAAAFDGLMQAWSGIGKTSPAIYYGKQSVNILQTIRGDAEKLDKDVQANFIKDNTATYRRLADLLIAEGRLPEAQQVLAMLKEKEYSEFLSRDADEAAKLAKVTERPDEKEALEKYSSYSKTLTADAAELGKLETAKNNLKDGEAFGQKARYEELKAKIESANKAFRVLLEKTLSADLDKAQLKDIKTDRALQGKLAKWGDGTVALYTLVAEDRYRVILTTPKTQIDGKTEIKAADLNKKINAFRQILLDPTLDPRPLGKELYDILVKPIEANLANADAKTLLWSLNGSLSYIPIGTLYDGEKYLAEKYQNVVVTSTTRASLDEETSKDWHVLGVGVTGSSEVKEPFGTGKIPFKALPAVGEELTAIVKTDGGKSGDGIMPGVRLMDATFTENSLKENVASRNAGERKYNVIHFATHFRLGNLPENSFLLLGNNEILTLEEVNDSTDLELSGIELVTLSACNTGFSGISGISADNTAIDSLAAFIESRGAKSVIATLWAVNDESTSLLMSEFYRLRKENPNISKAEALQTAQKMMIAGELKPSKNGKDDRSGVMFQNDNKPNAPKFTPDPKKPFAHPLYWSPFVLIGNWR